MTNTTTKKNKQTKKKHIWVIQQQKTKNKPGAIEYTNYISADGEPLPVSILDMTLKHLIMWLQS